MTTAPIRNDTEHAGGQRLRQFLSYRIARLHFALNAQAGEILDRVAGISLGRWRVLSVIGSAIASTSRDLCTASGLDPGFVSRTLRSLEDDGLIRTERTEQDRRVLKLALTDKGRSLYEDTLPHMQRRQRALLDTLDPAERQMVFRIFDKLDLAAEMRDFEP